MFSVSEEETESKRKREGEREGGIKGKRDVCSKAGRRCVSLRDSVFDFLCVIDALFPFY